MDKLEAEKRCVSVCVVCMCARKHACVCAQMTEALCNWVNLPAQIKMLAGIIQIIHEVLHASYVILLRQITFMFSTRLLHMGVSRISVIQCADIFKMQVASPPFSTEIIACFEFLHRVILLLCVMSDPLLTENVRKAHSVCLMYDSV